MKGFLRLLNDIITVIYNMFILNSQSHDDLFSSSAFIGHLIGCCCKLCHYNYSKLNQIISILISVNVSPVVLVTQIGKKSGRIIEIFDLVADMIFEILPTLQFMILFYTFGSSGTGDSYS